MYKESVLLHKTRKDFVELSGVKQKFHFKHETRSNNSINYESFNTKCIKNHCEKLQLETSLNEPRLFLTKKTEQEKY